MYTEATRYGLFKSNLSGLSLDDYDYPLPESCIARYPLAQRDASRMLVLNRQTGAVAHHAFHELSTFLQPNDLMVLNNTKVMPARFLGHRKGFKGSVEIFLLNPSTTDTQDGLQPYRSAEALCWTALMRPARKLKPGTVIEFDGSESVIEVLDSGERGAGKIYIHLSETDKSVEAFMTACGQMPIPPYLGRAAEESDKERYQTVFSSVSGAQAAPTAGLHFTEETLHQLKAKGVDQTEVTLAVSSGTFRTVEVDDIKQHQMDPEWYELPQQTATKIEQAKQRNSSVFAVGTTVAKTLETVACQTQQNWTAHQGWSSLFIYPGFPFQATDMLLTNFHLPKSTLLMLVSAFAGRDNIANAYREALNENYRFFSYGDCMLII